jgi:hypothetical protein
MDLFAVVSTDSPGTELPVPTDELVVGGLGIVGIFFIAFAVLFVGAVVLIVVSASRRYRAAKAAGLDPFAGDVQLMGQAKSSAMLAPQRSVADRLAEVDALRSAGTISAEEHAAARARILGTV